MRPLALRSILFATDLSESSADAARTAVELAELAGAALHTVYARTDNETDQEDLAERLRSVTADAGVPTSSQIMDGAPHEAIVERARAVDADVIVLGPHRRGVQGGPLGTTADAVVRTSHTPCLVLPSTLKLPLERVLTASDLSPAAQGAIAVALSWASALRRPSSMGGGTELRVVHVARGSGEGATAGTLRDEVERAKNDAVSAAHVQIQEIRVQGEDPAEKILDEARSSRSDLIVVGTRGQGAGDDGGIGSVSTAVIQKTSCPVLLVP